jgi:hypothetical protein
MAKGVEVTYNAGDVRTDDWPAQATDAIVKVVGTAHDKITGPIQTVAKAIVYGFLAAAFGLMAAVLGVILAVRVTNNYLPDAVFGENHIWAAYLIVGALFTLVGLWLMRKGRRAVPAD